MKALALKIPPALLMVLFGLMMWLMDQLLPMFKQQWPWHEWSARVFFFMGLAFILAGIISFKMAKTTVDPTHPSNASTVVTTGVYRLTRNPMYLGFFLMLLAFSIKLENPITISLLPLFVVYMNLFQINHEEKILGTLFGDEYTDYLKQVRRWI